MTGALVASVVIGLLAVRTRRSFAWDDPMIALMLVSAALMTILCASLLVDGQWKAALFMAPLVGALATPAIILGRVQGAPPARRRDDPEDGDGPGGDGGGGGGMPPDDPRPNAPEPGIDWNRFDEAREGWERSGSRSGV